MTLQIPIGISETYRTPGAYVQLLFGQGPSSAKVGEREACMVMPILATGTYTAGTLYEIDNEDDAISGGASGSPLHIGVRRFLRANQDVRLWVLPVAATTGGAPVQGTFAVQFTTDPTGLGLATVTIHGEDSSYSYDDSDTITTVAAGLAAIVNAKVHLPVTAGASVGVLTLTAKLAGTSQNNAIPVRSAVSAGTGISVSADGEVGDTVAGVEGSTTEAANTSTALANVATSQLYYMALSATDTTTVGHLVSHLTNKATPTVGIRSVGIAASRDTLANVTTLANAHNYERMQIVWQEDSEDHPASIAANMAAVRARYENQLASYPLGGYGGTDWLVPAAYDTADWPDGDDQSEAINDGVTPIASNQSGSYIVMSVNTRSKNSAGTVDDFRATETHRVSVGDYIAEGVVSLWTGNHQGKLFEDDERLADGSVNPNQTLRRGIVKPSQWSKEIKDFLADHASSGTGPTLLQGIAATIASVRAVKTGSRMETGFDVNVIDHAHQMTVRIAEVGGG